MPSRFRNFTGAILALVLVNFMLSGLKLWEGYESLSAAMRGTGFNNLADLFYALLLAVGLWITSQPADAKHPEGHERFESLMGLAVASVILLTGAAVIWDGIRMLQVVEDVSVTWSGWALLVVSMGCKAGLAVWLGRLGDRHNSLALTAVSRDQAADILVDFSVLLAWLAAIYGLVWVDGLVAIGIGVLVLKIGIDPMIESIHQLTGRTPEPELVEEVKRAVNSFPDCSEAYRIRAHHVGPSVHLSLNVSAPPDLSLEAVHQMEEQLREQLLDIDSVTRVFIHVEPEGTRSPN